MLRTVLFHLALFALSLHGNGHDADCGLRELRDGNSRRAAAIVRI